MGRFNVFKGQSNSIRVVIPSIYAKAGAFVTVRPAHRPVHLAHILRSCFEVASHPGFGRNHVQAKRFGDAKCAKRVVLRRPDRVKRPISQSEFFGEYLVPVFKTGQ